MAVFRVGQKVVCINNSDIVDGRFAGNARAAGIKHGSIYTVTKTSSPFIWLSELIGGSSGGWQACRFRSVVEKKTDISIFKEILAGTRQPEGVEA